MIRILGRDERLPQGMARIDLRRAWFPVLAILIAACAGCDGGRKLPDKSSKEYGNVVSAFHVGLAALQVGDDIRADGKLAEVTRIAPGEPAGWANWAVLALRQRNFDAASERLERARDLSPQSFDARTSLAQAYARSARLNEAIFELEEALKLAKADGRAEDSAAVERLIRASRARLTAK